MISAPLSGDVYVYINGNLVRDLTVPQSDYTEYIIDLSEFDSDTESEIVLVNQANTVYSSGSSYGQSGRMYFAGYENFESFADDEAPFIPFTGILLFFVLVVSIVISILR